VRLSPTPQAALGRAVGLRRRERGFSQEALADAANVDARTVRGIERGTANPTWDVVDRIARALGWSLAKLAELAEKVARAEGEADANRK